MYQTRRGSSKTLKIPLPKKHQNPKSGNKKPLGFKQWKKIGKFLREMKMKWSLDIKTEKLRLKHNNKRGRGSK
jgi:hypothetical protein